MVVHFCQVTARDHHIRAVVEHGGGGYEVCTPSSHPGKSHGWVVIVIVEEAMEVWKETLLLGVSS